MFLRSFLALVIISAAGSLVLAQEPSEPKLAEKDPAAKPIVTARQVLAAAFERTKTAESVDDYSDVIEQCERVLGVKLSKANAAYAHQLAAWAYNRRGEAYAEQAAALSEQGEERKANELDQVALADFESALQHDPSKWKAIQNRGVSRAVCGKSEEALADFAKVIELRPEYPNAWFNRAEILLQHGKFEEAASDYAQVLELKSGDVAALLGHGNALYRLRQYREALGQFEQALRFERDNAQALVGRGDVRSALGQWEAAAADYQRAIKLAPKLGRAYRGAAWLMATCPDENFRDADLAIESARKALALDGSGDYAYLDTLAAALASAGEFDDARMTQEKAIQIAPDAAVEGLRERLARYADGKPYRSTETTAQREADESSR